MEKSAKFSLVTSFYFKNPLISFKTQYSYLLIGIHCYYATQGHKSLFVGFNGSCSLSSRTIRQNGTK